MNVFSRVALVLLGLCAAAESQALCLGTTVVSGTTVNFQQYNPVSASPKYGNGTVTVGCSGVGVLSAYSISLSVGTGTGYTNRQLGSAANRLDYNLYVDPAYNTIWGNGLNGTGAQSYGGLLSLKTMDFTVYGRIPAGQDRPSGSYTTTITITVDFL